MVLFWQETWGRNVGVRGVGSGKLPLARGFKVRSRVTSNLPHLTTSDRTAKKPSIYHNGVGD
jgi:hypothetical protein